MTKQCLIADNNHFYLEFFYDLLTEFGFNVEKACDGLEALEKARARNFDLFVFDYVMPKIDGMRLAKYIKSMNEYKNTPVILITAAALESISWEVDELFADIVVAKGPLKKMRTIFSEILPNLESVTLEKGNKIFGLDDIYPRQIVKELLKVEVHHSAIFENLVEGIVELDESGMIIFANNAFLNLINKFEVDVIGHSIQDILSFEKFPDLRDAYEKITHANRQIRENVVVSFDDKTMHFAFYNILSDNNYSGSFLIVQDVTDIKRKINEIGSLFNISQAFLSNLPYHKVLEYVVYETRRLVKAVNITLLLSCEGFFEGDVISAVDRKLGKNSKGKIDFWVDKIREWKKDGLISFETIQKLNRVNFDNLPILWLPLSFKGRYLGTLLGFKHNNDDFDNESLKFFEAIGNQIAVYLANIEFFKRLTNFKGKETEIRQEIEGIVKQEYEDCISKYNYIKWNERNKKKIIDEIINDMNHALSTIRGYGAILTAVHEEDTPSISKEFTNFFLNPLHKITQLKNELNMIYKLGLDEGSKVQQFSMEDLINRLESYLSSEFMSIRGDIPTVKKLGDIETLSFLIGMFLKTFIRKNIDNIEIAIEKEEETILMAIKINIPYDNLDEEKKHEVDKLIDSFNEKKWLDFDNSTYYFYWHLACSMDMIGGVVKVISKMPLQINLEFPIQK